MRTARHGGNLDRADFQLTPPLGSNIVQILSFRVSRDQGYRQYRARGTNRMQSRSVIISCSRGPPIRFYNPIFKAGANIKSVVCKSSERQGV